MTPARQKNKTDSPADSALLDACKKAGKDFNLAACRALLARGANVNAMDSDKSTPLIWVALGRHNDLIPDLLSAGAWIDHRNTHGDTALIAAAYSVHPDTAEILIDAGARTDLKDNSGKTARDYAVSEGLFNLAPLLDPGPAGDTARQSRRDAQIRAIAEKAFRGADHARESAPVPPLGKRPLSPSAGPA